MKTKIINSPLELLDKTIGYTYKKGEDYDENSIHWITFEYMSKTSYLTYCYNSVWSFRSLKECDWYLKKGKIIYKLEFTKNFYKGV